MSANAITALSAVAVYAVGAYATIVFLGWGSPKSARRFDCDDLILVVMWPVMLLCAGVAAIAAAWLAAAAWLRVHAPRGTRFMACALRIVTLPLRPWRIGRLLAGRGWE